MGRKMQKTNKHTEKEKRQRREHGEARASQAKCKLGWLMPGAAHIING